MQDNLKVTFGLQPAPSEKNPLPRLVVTDPQNYTNIANQIISYGSNIPGFEKVSKGILPKDMAFYVARLFESRDSAFEDLLTQTYPIGGSDGGN